MTFLGVLAGCASPANAQKLAVRVLILPKFEVDEITGDFPGEAQLFYEEYLAGGAWANRSPQVLRGTSVTGDNYWKGEYDHQNALLITETYKCRDPYAIAEMENLAVGLVAKRFHLLERLIVLRVGVNMDVFPAGVTPEILWAKAEDDELASEESIESIDIFETAMHNCFDAWKVLIDAVLQGEIPESN